MIETLRSVLRFRRPQLDPVPRRLARAASVADLRAIARRRLPRGVFDYIDGGAEDERTMAANAAAFAAVTIERVLSVDSVYGRHSTKLAADAEPSTRTEGAGVDPV
jgi:FMN-dependent dehydrogenase